MDIIILEPANEGNLGAIARVMKNFGFERLVLVNPKCKIGSDAIKRAKHAKDLLSKARIAKKIGKYDYLIGTTAKLGTDFNISRSPISPEELAGKIKKIEKKTTKIGILFGREGIGLKNKEIGLCDFVVTIPTQKSYSAMNISHSIAIILYELSKGKENITSHINPITKKEKDVILGYIDKTLDKMDFASKEKKDTQRKLWKRVIGKAMLTKREAYALMGFFRKNL